MSEQLLLEILEEVKSIKTEQQIQRELLQNHSEQLQHQGEQLQHQGEQLQRLSVQNQQIWQAVTEIDATVKRIEVTQEQHDQILDVLSRRSIDQEARLKRIN